MEQLIQLISNVGFPIAMCVIMCWYVKALNETINTTINSMCNKLDTLITIVTDKFKGEE